MKSTNISTRKLTVWSLEQLPVIMTAFHTVHSIMQETGKSRSWAYSAMQKLPKWLLIDKNGQQIIRCVKRKDFTEYVQTLRRPGNPNWG